MADDPKPHWATGECLSDEDRVFVEVMFQHWSALEAERILFTTTPNIIAVKAIQRSIELLVAAITKISTG